MSPLFALLNVLTTACYFSPSLSCTSASPQALAKELSAKGKAAAEAMWAAHERASSQIYSQRNARLQQQVAGSGKGSAGPVIDLHGGYAEHCHCLTGNAAEYVYVAVLLQPGSCNMHTQLIPWRPMYCSGMR